MIPENLTENEAILSQKNLADFIQSRREAEDIFYWVDSFYEATEFQRKMGYHMYRRVLKSPNQGTTIIEDPVTGEDRKMIMLGSNSYLSLNNHPKVRQAGIDAINKYGMGAGSPPHFSGYYEVHRQLEKKLAMLKGTEAAMVYPSGYSTNVGILSAFLTKKDTVILDRLAHASIIDGALLSGAKIRTFKHNDPESLEKTLQKAKSEDEGDILVVVEGVYSMDGDIAQLDKIYPLVKEFNAKLMVDEAHATGVLGKHGKGSPEHFNLEGKIDIVMGTFSKSLGGVGGFVTARKEIINYLRYYSRAYFFAGSPTPPQVAAQAAAIDVLLEEPQWHQRLWENVNFFHTELRNYGFDLENTETPITPVTIGDQVKMNQVTKFLHEHNIFVNPVPYPAVARNKDRLRISLSASLTLEQLAKVRDVLIEADQLYKFSKKFISNVK